jgi:hephaestin
MGSRLLPSAGWLSSLVTALLVVALAAVIALRPNSTAGRTRTYYLAADPVAWDYVPGGSDAIAGHPFADSAFFRDSTRQAVSTSYRKVLYRQYTDSTFTRLTRRPAQWQHLGFLGPVLHASVGDTIRVVFRNHGDRPYSVHPHGVFYEKDSEGAPYADGTSGGDKLDDGVAPGATHVYLWPVPERAGPAHGEGSSVMWMYHSHTDETRDVNTGLLGVMVVTARGMARPDGSPKDVDREIIAVFDQVHEEDSWLVDKNLPADLMKRGPMANPSQRQNFYPWFVKFTINGFAHGSLPLAAFTLRKGDRVRWYVMSSTNDFDLHAPHWHGNTVVAQHMRTDVLSVSPMEMVVADMRPDSPGTWLFHCHISFHNAAGMAARYVVAEETTRS